MPIQVEKRSRTLIIHVTIFPQISETFIIQQIEVAAALGFKVKVLAYSINYDAIPFYSTFFEKFSIASQVILVPISDKQSSFKKLSLLLSSIKPLITDYKNWKRFDIYNNSGRLDSIVKYNFLKTHLYNSIVHVHFGDNHKPFDFLKSLSSFNFKLIVSFYGHDSFFPLNGFINETTFYDRLFKTVDKVNVVSSYLGDAVKNLGCPREVMIIIPASIDTIFFKESSINIDPCSFPIQLITIGRLHPVKGQSYAIEVIRELHNRGVAAQLSIIGEGAQRNDLEALIKNYDLKDHIALKGALSRDEIIPLLDDSDIYLGTSVTFDERQETLGLTIVEAQARGLPVVAFDTGGVSNTFKDKSTGFLVPEYDIKTMVSQVVALFQNRKLYNTFSNCAREFSKSTYSSKAVAVNWNKVYSVLDT